MAVQLTAGFCRRLGDGNDNGDSFLDSSPTVQLLSTKRVPPTGGVGVDRYRLIVSDGENFVQSMLATNLNHIIEEDQVGKNAIVIIDKFTCNLVQEKRLLIILGFHVLHKTYEKIGSPVSMTSSTGGGSAASPSPAVPSFPAPASASDVAPSTSHAQAPPQPQPQSRRPMGQSSKGGRPEAIFKIEGLSPYQNNWTIKALVTQKSEIKTWSNQKGEGKLFNVTLMDDSAEIRATAFNVVVDDLYEKLQEGKVYFISKARVNLAKRKFSNLSNEYELSLDRGTVVEECLDTTNVPTVKYNFTSIEGLNDLPKDSTCDILAVVKEVGPLGEIVSKTTNKTIPKRELTLVDGTNYSVRLTLWGKQAEQFAEERPVIACKGVKVGDFGGRSLSMVSSSTMAINPDITEAHAIRGWFDGGGGESEFHSHTSTTGTGGAAAPFNRAELRNLDDVKESELGTSDKAEFFATRATLMHIRGENIAYPACPNPGCNKKVIQAGDAWRCEKCDRSFEKPEHRYIISMAASDYSSQAWLQGFNDVGQVVFGMSADELVDIKERDEAKYNSILEHAVSNTYNFTCRAKQDTYNEQTRVRYGIQRILPLDYIEETKYLIELLQSPWSMGVN